MNSLVTAVFVVGAIITGVLAIGCVILYAVGCMVERVDKTLKHIDGDLENIDSDLERIRYALRDGVRVIGCVDVEIEDENGWDTK